MHGQRRFDVTSLPTGTLTVVIPMTAARAPPRGHLCREHVHGFSTPLSSHPVPRVRTGLIRAAAHHQNPPFSMVPGRTNVIIDCNAINRVFTIESGLNITHHCRFDH